MIKHRIKTKDGYEVKELSPVRAIKAKCMECSNWQYSEVKTCHMTDCSLFPYRMGKNPAIKMTDEQKKAAAQRLEIARESISAPRS